ncbi:DUF6194 family protein [Streptomyces sp. NBC_01497]|uniref:DUF6194 family protein n=1 Tax=Streptomyces sp. NBC_01497 TaxID=2903885 RepID=UPI002E32C0E4|nr:DUF6194 family protein [Streptomyces sp. NBC_01497]
MTEDDIIGYVRSLPGAVAATAVKSTGEPAVTRGDAFLPHAPDGDTPKARRFPFATLGHPGFGTASGPARPGVFPLGAAVGRKRSGRLLGHGPGTADTPDHTGAGRLLPPPVYAAQGRASVLNPAGTTSARARALPAAVHDRARRGRR